MTPPSDDDDAPRRASPRRAPKPERARQRQFNRNVFGPMLGLLMALVSAGIADQSSTPADAGRDQTDSAPAPEPSAPPSDSVGVVVEGLLARIQVREEGTREGYGREQFPHWSDLDGDGCNTRKQVLIDEREDGTVEGCNVAGGSWHSFYDARTETVSSRVDVDHMVPLAEAWDSGASAWTRERRQRYANDLGYDEALVAVTRASNRSKSDRDPAEWMPTDEQAWCRYATAWTTVKIRWGLNADVAELNAVRQMFTKCIAPPPTDVELAPA